MFQKTIISGRLTRDPEMRFKNNGQPWTKFSVAVNRVYYKGDGDGNYEKVEEVTFFNVVVWIPRLAENCNKYLRKGSVVIVESSRMEASAYMSTKTGEPAASLELTADAVTFMPGGSNGNGQTAGGGVDVGDKSREELSVNWD